MIMLKNKVSIFLNSKIVNDSMHTLLRKTKDKMGTFRTSLSENQRCGGSVAVAGAFNQESREVYSNYDVYLRLAVNDMYSFKKLLSIRVNSCIYSDFLAQHLMDHCGQNLNLLKEDMSYKYFDYSLLEDLCGLQGQNDKDIEIFLRERSAPPQIKYFYQLIEYNTKNKGAYNFGSYTPLMLVGALKERVAEVYVFPQGFHNE